MGKNFITMRKLHALLFFVLITTQVKGFARIKNRPASLLENSFDPEVRCGPWGLFRDCDHKNTKTRIRLCKYRRGEAPDLSHKRGDLTESDWERMANFFKTTGPKDTEEYVHQPDIQTIPCDYEDSTPSHGRGSHDGERPRLNVSSTEFDPDQSNSNKNFHNGHQDSTADFKIDHKIEEIHDINRIDGSKSTHNKVEAPKVPTVDINDSTLSKKRNKGGKKAKNDEKKRIREEKRRKNQERLRLQIDLAEQEILRLQSERDELDRLKSQEHQDKIRLQEELDKLASQKDLAEEDKIRLQEELSKIKSQKDLAEQELLRLQRERDELDRLKSQEHQDKIRLQEELDRIKSEEEQERLRLQAEQDKIISQKQMELELQKREFDSEMERQNSEWSKQLEQIRLDLERSDKERFLLEKELSEQLKIQNENDPEKLAQLERERLRDEWNREKEKLKHQWEQNQEKLRNEMSRLQKERDELDRLKSQEHQDKIRLQEELDRIKSEEEQERLRLQAEQDKIISQKQMELELQKREFDSEMERQNSEWSKQLEQIRLDLERSDKERFLLEKELSEQLKIQNENDPEKVAQLERERLRDEWNREKEKLKHQWEQNQEKLRNEMSRLQRERDELDRLKSQEHQDKIRLQEELDRIKSEEEQERLRLQAEQDKIISQKQMELELQKREFDSEMERQNSEWNKQLEQIRLDLERSDKERFLLEKELSEQLKIQKENVEDTHSQDTGRTELPLIPPPAGGLTPEISQRDLEIERPFGAHNFPEGGLSSMKGVDSSIEFSIPPKNSVSVSDSEYNKSMNDLNLPFPKLDLKPNDPSTHHDESLNKVGTNTDKNGDQLAHGSKDPDINNIKSTTKLSEVSKIPASLPPSEPLVPEPSESEVKMPESMKHSGSGDVLDSGSHDNNHMHNTRSTMNTGHKDNLPDSDHEDDDGDDTEDDEDYDTDDDEEPTTSDTADEKRDEKSEELDSRVTSRPVHPHEVSTQSPELKPTKQHGPDESEETDDVDGPDDTDEDDDFEDEDEDDYDYEEDENSEDENSEGNFSRGAKIAGGIIGALIAIGAAGTGYYFTSKRKVDVIELDEIDFDYAQVGECEEVETAVLITEDVWEDEAQAY